MPKNEETPEVEDVVEEIEEAVEDAADDSEEEDNWTKMESLVGKVVEEKLTAWQQKQKTTTSSRSPRKQAQKPPERKKGFLSTGFFSGLTDDK